MTRVFIVDYDLNNLRSLCRAVEVRGGEPCVVSRPEQLDDPTHIIIPGVGNFAKAMALLDARGWPPALRQLAAAQTPILGICLGMQLLFERSEELGGADGLGLLPGAVTLLEAPGLKVPNIGWAPVRWERESRLTNGIASETPFYLVHSFVARPNATDTLGTAEYGERFACAVERGNVFGAQFHPEKSSEAGLRLLANFAGICAKAPAAA